MAGTILHNENILYLVCREHTMKDEAGGFTLPPTFYKIPEEYDTSAGCMALFE
jgi:hypothetical protein